MRRHDLLFLTEAALAHVVKSDPSGAVRLLTPQIPAIVRRQENVPGGFVAVGFALPLWKEGSRVRLSACIPAKEVRQVLAPFDVAGLVVAKKDRHAAVVQALVALGHQCGLRVGVYGSCALQVVTGLPYMRETSDLDLYLQATAARPLLPTFYQKARGLGQKHSLALDMEMECDEAYGVKLTEILSTQQTVVGKGLNDAKLLPRTDLTY